MELKKYANGSKIAFLDEGFQDLSTLSRYQYAKEISDFCNEMDIAWIAFSNSYFGERLSSEETPESYLQQNFPDFKIVKMEKSLRLPGIIAQDIKNNYVNQLGKTTDLSFNQKLAADSMMASNLVQGTEIKEFGWQEITGLCDSIKKATVDMPTDSYALFVIDDSDFQPENQTLKSQLKCENCKHLIHALIAKNAINICGRKDPLFHLIHYSSPENEIKQWINGLKREQDLVVSYNFIKGFEHEFIVDLTNSIAIKSRCSGQIIPITFNVLLEGIILSETLLKSVHVCSEILNCPVISTGISQWTTQKLSKKGFMKSETKPELLGLFVLNKNPILEVLSDQMNNSSDSSEHWTGDEILELILEKLEKRQISWPREFQLIQLEEWIQKMKLDSIFHRNYVQNVSEFVQFDNLLIELCSQSLERSIEVRPFLDEDPPKIFGSNFSDNQKLFIFCNNNLLHRSFYASAFPESNVVDHPARKRMKFHI